MLSEDVSGVNTALRYCLMNMMMMFLVGLFFCAIVLPGCSGDHGNGVNDESDSDTLATETVCDDGAELHKGEYVLSNNVWGKGDRTDYEQCVTVIELKNGLQFGWEWSWPDDGSDNVKAYPEIIYGWKPWSSQSSAPSLPVKLSDVDSIIVSFQKIRSILYGSGNLAFDLWITSSVQPNPGNIEHEVMIWLERDILRPGGSKQATVAIDGHTYDFYRGDWDWTYLAFILQSEEDVDDFRLDTFLDFLVEEGHVLEDEYLANIEFGNEIVYGSGKTVIQDYTIEVY